MDQDCAGRSDFDQDQDGLDTVAVDGGTDCDDTDPAVGAARVLHRDADDDGFGDPSAPIALCDPPADAVPDDQDCDDTDPNVSPNGAEVCGGLDEDCDGLVDDLDPDVDAATFLDWYADGDEDGFSGDVWVATACAGPPGSSADGTDCDDADPARNPGELERCNLVDDDCDAWIDAEDPSVDPAEAAWYADVDGDGFGNQDTVLLSCEPVPSRSHQGGDCADHDPAVSPAATEICGGSDEDCDTLVDEADPDLVAIDWYTDADADGAGALPIVATGCAPVLGASPTDDDCDDGDPDVHPAAPEGCGGGDEDCDGLVDEDDPGLVTGWWRDLDQDGWGGAAVATCAGPDPAWVSFGGDCDDGAPDVNPGELEVWYDGVDSDCSGDTDVDQDGDGIVWLDDCDDTDPLRGGSEVWYDGIDQDCDGASDYDQDGDGYDTIPYGADCNDVEATAYPGAREIYYDDIDHDCLGGSDWDADLDGVDFVPRGADCFDEDPLRDGGGLVTVEFPGAFGSLADAVDALACDSGVVEVAAALVDDPNFTQATITRPVTIRGAGAGLTVFEDVVWDARADLTVEGVSITGSRSTPIVVDGSTVRLVGVDCFGNDQGCLRAGGGVSVWDSTFSDNGGVVIQAQALKFDVLRSTFGPGDEAVFDLQPGSPVTLEDVGFVGEAVSGGAVIALTDPDATLRRVTWTGCEAEALLRADGAGTLTLEDLAGADNVLDASAVAVRGSAIRLALDGLALSDTTTVLGPVVDLSGLLDQVDRVRIVGTTSSDAALAVVDQRDQPVLVNHLLVAGHLGTGLRTTAVVTLRHATVVGADIAVEQANGDPVNIAGSLLVGNRVGIAVGPGWLPHASDTPPDLGYYATDVADGPWYYDDVDGDGLPDGWELRWGADLPSDDVDGDRLDTFDEYAAGSSPNDPDTDLDGIDDGIDGWPLDSERF